LSKEAGLTVVAVGEDRVFSRSNDGGVTWAAPVTTSAQAPLAPLNWAGTTGIGGTSAVAVGADQRGGMYSVYNGSAWSALVYIGSFADTPTPFGFQLLDVAYTVSTIVAVGKNGIVTRSTNGGLDWTAPVSVTTFDLLDIEFFDALNGLAVGTGGSAIRTTDGGVTWSTPIHAADATLNALAIVDSSVSSVSEPSSIALVMIGFLGLIVRKKAIARLPSLQRLRANFVYLAN
jgi:photosystem II stability/assembly factor-like uncharacterized protein